ncbi:MAG: hypothetical protein ABR574_13630 [Cryomorphaceae bacterium]
MKKSFAILGLLFLLPAFLFAQEESIRKISINSKPNQTLKIDNSFGKIEVSTYDGAYIDVTVVITAEDRKVERAREFLDNTVIDQDYDGNTVELRTVRKSKTCKLKNFSIDYTVKIPEGTNLDINNRFGDVLIYESGGEVKVDVSHGDCRLMGVTKSKGKFRNELRVKFGRLEAENIIDGVVRVEHGDINISRITDSDIDLRFGNGKVGLLEGEIEIKLSHSTLNIDDLGSKIKDFNADVEFSNLRVYGYAPENFVGHLKGSFSNFKFPKNLSVLSDEPSMNRVEYQIRGKEAGKNAPTIKVEARHSTVTIK